MPERAMSEPTKHDDLMSRIARMYELVRQREYERAWGYVPAVDALLAELKAEAPNGD